MKIPLKEEIYALEKLCAKKYGMPKLLLMENAGASAVRAINGLFSGRAGLKYLVICGPGNNGGDGAVIARKLFLENPECVTVVLLNGGKGAFSGKTDASVNFSVLKNYRVPILTANGARDLVKISKEIGRCDVIIDAIYGIGFRPGGKNAATAFMNRLIDRINRSGKTVVSVDLPSGVLADGGVSHPVRANHTVSFAFPKAGTVDYPGREFSGKVSVVPIDLPAEIMNARHVKRELVTDVFAKRNHRNRPANSHKGNFGHLLVIGGFAGNDQTPAMSGAVILASMAALKSGAGLLTAAVPEKIAGVVQKGVPEAMVAGLSGDPDTAAEMLESIAGSKKIGAILIGNGFGTGPYQERLVKWALTTGKTRKLVFDADALNVLSRSDSLKKILRTKARGPKGKIIILTPHVGEMSRLSGKSIEAIKGDKWNIALDFAGMTGAVTVLKDAVTCIASPDGRLLVNDSGSPALAKGGSGDVLAGIISGLLVSGYEAPAAGALGAYLLGKAGEMYVQRGGTESALARDIVGNLPACFKALAQ